MKKLFILLAMLLALNYIGVTVYADDEITVYLNKNKVSFDTAPTIINNRTMVPMRALFEALGATVNWDAQTQNIMAVLGNDYIMLTVNSTKATVKGQPRELDTAPIIVDNRTLVPLRFVAESTGAQVAWLANEKRIEIIKTLPYTKDDILFLSTTNAATVNGEAITLSEYKFYTEQFKAIIAQQSNSENNLQFWLTGQLDGKSALTALKDRTLDEISKTTIAAQKAKKAGITLDDKDKQELEQTKAYFMQSRGGNDGKEFFNSLGLTDVIFNSLLEKEFLKQKFYSLSATSDIKITDSEIAELIKAGTISAKHILISTMNPDQTEKKAADLEAAKKKAEDILAKIKAGGDFDKLMTENTEDPGIKSNPTGYAFKKGEMIKEFEEAAFTLKLGEVSGLVKTQYGYHIIKRDNAALTLKLQREKLPKLIEGWKAESKIEVKSDQIEKIS